MAWMVTLLGVLSAAIGVVGTFRPERLVSLVAHWHGAARFWLAVLVRLVVGVALLVVAPACRWPWLVRVLGVVAVMAALVILGCGQQRLDRLIAWWLSRPELVRVSALFALALGLLLIYAGVPLG